MVLYSFDVFNAMLKVDYKQLTKHDRDNFVCLVGKEGDGKSNLGLWAVQRWLELSNVPLTSENFKKCMGVTVEYWSKILKDVGEQRKHFWVTDLDEAGDVMSGKHSNTKVVTAIEDAWKVIRGLNLLTIVTSPSLFILSPYVRYHRIRVCWYVSSRGVCHVYFGETLKKLLTMNENKPFKDMFAVKPDFSFVFPKYEGVFINDYLELKHKKMYNVLSDLNEIVKNVKKAKKK